MENTTQLINKEIEITLTQVQMDERRDESATLQVEIDELESELNTLTTKFKAEKKVFDEDIGSKQNKKENNLREIKSGKATILAEVKMVKNFDKGLVEYFYPAEGKDSKLVEERPLTANEHQLDLIPEPTSEEIKQGEVEASQISDEGQVIDESNDFLT